MSEPMEDQRVADLKQVLREVLAWSQGQGEHGPYCKLCKGEGIDVEHEGSCPISEISRVVHSWHPELETLSALLEAVLAREKEEVLKWLCQSLRRAVPRAPIGMSTSSGHSQPENAV